MSKILLLLFGAVAVSALVQPTIVGTKAQQRPGWMTVFETEEAMRNARMQLFSDEEHQFVTWSFGTFHGIGGQAPLEKFQKLQGVKYIQNNLEIHMLGEQLNPTWGLDRSDQLTLPLNNLYRWNDARAGQGVNVYILDTGIYTQHNDWNLGQANFLGDCSDLFGLCNGNAQGDPHGHGTHCAGTVASPTFGIAKNATVWDMKVLNAQGSGGLFGIISGFDRVASHAVGGPKIISMSLGAARNAGLDDAVAGAVAAGVTCVAAAGNEDQDACNVSPGGAPEAISAAATDIQDVRASFSNFGVCVDIFAPGVNIVSLGPSPDGQMTYSGTSMACPHTAGAAALLASGGLANPEAIRLELARLSSKGQVRDERGSPNQLLFTNPV